MTKIPYKYLNKVSKLRLNGKTFRSANINLHNKGFSLIELIIVIIILIIIAILGIPFFLKLIDMARFESAKNHMRGSFTNCINDPNASPSNPYIPGVTFQSSDCSGLMSATIDDACTISMDMSTGAKTGWTDSYDQCVLSANTASNNSSSSNDSSSSDSNDASSQTEGDGQSDEDQIATGPSCNEGPGGYGGGKHCNCETYKYTPVEMPEEMGGGFGSLKLECLNSEGTEVDTDKPVWFIPYEDTSGNTDWLRYEQFLKDGGEPDKVFKNP